MLRTMAERLVVAGGLAALLLVMGSASAKSQVLGGRYDMTVSLGGQSMVGTVELRQDGSTLEATVEIPAIGLEATGDGSYSDGRYTIEFEYDLGCPAVTVLSGTVDSTGALVGAIENTDCNGVGEGDALLVPRTSGESVDTGAGSPEHDFDRQAWLSDIDVLDRMLRLRHVDLFHSISEPEYSAALEAFRSGIGEWSEARTVVELARFIAGIGDGHTTFFAPSHPALDHRYPFLLWFFEDGLRVLAATEEFAELAGARLVSIDDTPVEDVYAAISPLIAKDNRMGARYYVIGYFNPVILQELGLVDDATSAEVAFVPLAGGPVRRRVVNTHPSAAEDELIWVGARSWISDVPTLGLTHLLASPMTIADYQYYWYRVLPEDRAIYFQYNVCFDAEEGPPFVEVTDEVLQRVDAGGIDRVVIDLRHNTGGEPLTARPLIDGLSERVEQKGLEVTVIVGRRTFSASLTNAIELRNEAGASLIGEYPAGKPNNPSEGRPIHLPRTDVVVRYSSQFLTRDPALGNAEFLPLERLVPLSIDDYVRGVDRPLEIALGR
ncbi:MAG: hypothetical protein R3324_05355 [Halobacteriales archaeon]|nr:hypothetical protein [Halobacteriales archaeon]